MRILKLSALVLGSMVVAEPAFAQSCYDLWYERNAIYDNRGYCFQTELGQDTFDNSDCYTGNPRFSRSERNRIAQIKRQERAMGCKVNR